MTNILQTYRQKFCEHGNLFRVGGGKGVMGWGWKAGDIFKAINKKGGGEG